MNANNYFKGCLLNQVHLELTCHRAERANGNNISPFLATVCDNELHRFMVLRIEQGNTQHSAMATQEIWQTVDGSKPNFLAILGVEKKINKITETTKKERNETLVCENFLSQY